jgi:hypothetical protein
MNMSTIARAASELPHNPIRMAEVLAAFSLVTDLRTGKSMGHALRGCYLALAMARGYGNREGKIIGSAPWVCSTRMSSYVRQLSSAQ